tara:strand:+ start:1545 stop:1934 length:390 start_codon:yes stop_codon:yes gene_type:complete
MPKIEVSVGELIDKITILEIKQERIEDEAKLTHINAELDILRATVEQEQISVPEELIQELKDINTELWDAEDVIRICEKEGDFGGAFVDCARLDAILNDKRFLAKNEINECTKSLVKEQKSYEGLYTTD